MLDLEKTVNFYENDQQKLSRLFPEWRRLKQEKKYFEADELKHEISLLKRRIKHGL